MSHLTQRQVEEYQRRALSPRELLAVDDHIATCEACRLRLAAGEPLSGALAAWEELAPPAPAPAVARFPLRRLAVIAALAAVLVAVAGLGVWLAARVPQRPAVELADGGGRVALSPQGELVGLASLPPQWRRDVAAALRTGRLDRPRAIADLAAAEPALRGAASTAPFTLLAPVATAVAGGRPLFRWTPLSAARSFEVKVFDPDLHPMAASGPLTGTEWTPDQPLPVGTVYAWQVMAHLGNEDVIAPGPQAPPALFRVLAADQARAVESAAREAGGSPLALGVLYARAGLVDDAERELARVAAANPGSATARELLASVRSWRSAAAQPPSPTSTNGAQ
ncbi:MAG TPA: zf-HC2 domain-containing protein [Thermoanaerobaculia bacterium]